MATTLTPGTTIAMRYRVRALLGSGGMGHVYRAEHLGLCKDVALKVLSPSIEPGWGDLETRFEREARALARLDHPGCVRVYDYGRTPDRRLYIAMEMLDGPTLAGQLAQGGAFSPERTIGVATQVLRALAHAHRNAVIHRDIKPENVMLTHRDGVPRLVLIDFGLAHRRRDARLTADGVCVGSPSYVAPERLLGRPYDGRADLYSVGVMMYELLTGTRPFTGDSPQAIIRAHVDSRPVPLRTRRRDLPRALEKVVLRALAKQPGRRFADAEAMLSALAAVPAEQDRAAAALAATRSEEATTTTMAEIRPLRPSRMRRLWGWIRYGPWRWSRFPDNA
jgi:serine/threonine-protein kinase